MASRRSGHQRILTMESEWHFIADGTNHVCIMYISGQQVDRELSPDRFASHRVLRGAHAMTRKVVERSISTTANIYLADGHGQEFDTYRELVMQENEDGTWLVYALRPRTAEVDRLDDGIISGSIKVADEETRAFFVDLFSLLADPGTFGETWDST